MIARTEISKIVLKRFEGRARDNSFEERVEYEAAVMIAGATRGVRGIFKKMSGTIAKDLGNKGRARYLANLDTSWFPEFDKRNNKEKEAIHAAWSELP